MCELSDGVTDTCTQIKYLRMFRIDGCGFSIFKIVTNGRLTKQLKVSNEFVGDTLSLIHI